MSLRSRTLRARMLRLSRRAMRLTIRVGSAEARTAASSSLRFAQLIWRRTRVLRARPEKASVLHLHDSHALIRPDVRVSVQMYLATSKASRPAAGGWPQSSRLRRPEMPHEGPPRRLRWPRPSLDFASHRPRILPFLVDSPARAASLARRVIASVLMSWPARALNRADGLPHSGAAPREAALVLPAPLRTGTRSGPAGSPERRRPLRRESSLLPSLTSYRLLDPRREAGRIGARPPAFLPAARLRRREAAAAGSPQSNLLAWREMAPATLHYAGPRATAVPLAHIEHPAAAPASSTVTHPMQPPAQAARAVPAAVLDRAATDRLADEVIRRIERRVRIERERRGI